MVYVCPTDTGWSILIGCRTDQWRRRARGQTWRTSLEKQSRHEASVTLGLNADSNTASSTLNCSVAETSKTCRSIFWTFSQVKCQWVQRVNRSLGRRLCRASSVSYQLDQVNVIIYRTYRTLTLNKIFVEIRHSKRSQTIVHHCTSPRLTLCHYDRSL